jgi:hypothetical protein
MDFEDDEEEYEQNFPRIKKEEIDDGYQEFKSQQARGILYKLSPLTNDIQQKVTDYVHNGAMQADLRYARELFGLINTSGRRDFSYVWESPWIEEHVRDTAKRRKIETQQRSTAVRNFLKASSSHDSDNVDKFMQNVDQLTKWEETYDSKEDVKTISRIVQSFEHVAARQLLSFCESVSGQNYTRVQTMLQSLRKSQHQNDVECVANSLRRSPDVYDLFANIVACEINWADGTNGSKNLSIYASRQLEYKKENALIKMMHGLDKIHGKEITKDNIGLPLMNIDFNICVSKGVLLVGSNSNSATYILDIEDNNDANGRLDLSGVKTIKIIQKFDNNSLIPKHEKSKKQETQKGFLDL